MCLPESTAQLLMPELLLRSSFEPFIASVQSREASAALAGSSAEDHGGDPENTDPSDILEQKLETILKGTGQE